MGIMTYYLENEEWKYYSHENLYIMEFNCFLMKNTWTWQTKLFIWWKKLHKEEYQ
jgi:hypothetical protein